MGLLPWTPNRGDTATSSTTMLAPNLATLPQAAGIPAGAAAAAFTGGFNWTRLVLTLSPPARQNAEMAFDSHDHYALLFGGGTRNGALYAETWAFRNGTWTNLSPPVSPPSDTGSNMVYDTALGEVLYFDGNRCGGSCGNLWAFSGGHWSNVTPSISPPARRDGYLGYNPTDGNVVLFGGFNGSTSTYLNDTWVLHKGSWSMLSTPIAPSPRSDANEGGLTYDAKDGYFVLFGGDSGFGSSSFYNDTWMFLHGSWSRVHTTIAPSGRAYETMAFDPARHGVVMFGGLAPKVQRNTWLYSAGAWTNVTGGEAPMGSYDPSSTYDTAAGFLLLFGGGDCNCGPAVSRATWAYH
jgi:hypothetical protein